ncbi:MAG: hypothetical protein EPN97_03815 [Alphaproteobacteria bacterium]|nr:MAG: hypothetical protein EPN97_03815 [Alphaproteobacteria bacterium]
MIIRFIPFLFLLLLAWAGPASAEAPPNRYFEVVRELPGCSGGDCFVEYVVLSNGIMVKKKFDTDDHQLPAVITVRKTGGVAVNSLFDEVSAFFHGRSNSGSRMDDLQNVFYYDGEKFYAYASHDAEAPGYRKLFQAADTAFAQAAPSDDFYVHAYYEPAKGNTKDFHIASDGTVIASMFGKQTYLIVYTFMSQTGESELKNLRALGAAAMKSATARYRKCAPASGLGFGFLEMKMDGDYVHSYACGDEGNSVSALFNYIRSTYEDMKPPAR